MGYTLNQFNPKTDLILERIVELPPEKLFAGWTTPELLLQWFCPKPWQTVDAQVDLRPGGIFRCVMKSPEGEEHPCSGCILEVVRNERLVWTDLLEAGYRPSPTPFFTAALTFERHPQGTKYVAHAMHPSEEVRKKHEEMGFHTGWNLCLDQLTELMKSRV